ncbi:hypothetical protein [Bosea rubneri]|uniref:Uncharacterized protein n=1 Tax=Bosea rubneri TaxID=3075434 RepID=A0ABU3S5S0_9HYPH|nr:hypothetical protein [Bosea sp. ZW T0_25]MDU0340130.1 hypothetical protein [Bosea sp. ZW T0_25]
MAIFRWVSLAISLGLTGYAMWGPLSDYVGAVLAQGSPRASSPEHSANVRNCDVLAGNPEDPERVLAVPNATNLIGRLLYWAMGVKPL